MPTLAENIKLYRKRARLTQKELASKLGVAPTAVSAWELGRNKPLMDNIESMALLFDIKKSVLLGEDLVVLSTTTAPNSLIEQVSEKMVQLTEPNQKNVLRYSSELLDKQNTVTDSKNTVSELQATYHTYNYYDQPASAGTGQYLNDVKVETIELPIEVDADFVVPIYGDSMEPKIKNGDFLFIKIKRPSRPKQNRHLPSRRRKLCQETKKQLPSIPQPRLQRHPIHRKHAHHRRSRGGV